MTSLYFSIAVSAHSAFSSQFGVVNIILFAFFCRCCYPDYPLPHFLHFQYFETVPAPYLVHLSVLSGMYSVPLRSFCYKFHLHLEPVLVRLALILENILFSTSRCSPVVALPTVASPVCCALALIFARFESFSCTLKRIFHFFCLRPKPVSALPLFSSPTESIAFGGSLLL